MEVVMLVSFLTAAGCCVAGCTETPLRYKYWLYVKQLRPVAWVAKPFVVISHTQEPFNFKQLGTDKKMHMNVWTCVDGNAHFITQDVGLRDECIAALKKNNIPHLVSIVGLYDDYILADVDVDETMPLQKAHNFARNACNSTKGLGYHAFYSGFVMYRVQVCPNWCDKGQYDTFIAMHN